MSRSLDHWIDKKRIEEKQRWYKTDSEHSGKPGFNRSDSPENYEYKSVAACSAKGCYKMPEHRCCYKYVTGKAGRISSAERYYCADHAIKFAVKNGIDIKGV